MDSDEKKRILELSDIVDEATYLTLEQSKKMHPLVELIQTAISSSHFNEYRYHNVLRAYNLVKTTDSNWIKEHRDTICGNDISSSSAALGELRCYGSLI